MNSDPKAKKKLAKQGSIEDDANWLPEGPKFRQNKQGVKRFARGYLAYAGAGKNSRGTQLIVALKDNGPLAGGSPWVRAASVPVFVLACGLIPLLFIVYL